ncbi:hypothetical protein AUC68_10165 [Methyloceanibacter methanicus]|uniref:Uncharacterized protein n=1 Tax=Methyloceanibacter methanicus TaxID=1774968 RepID=A0A1E3VWI0_9HYPH|nr:hypothetical protein [Methyloceanibacter methanicus]ODR97893.1 hypothetical protein AUC68_10165 [Methyloceanibacter methanicus]
MGMRAAEAWPVALKLLNRAPLTAPKPSDQRAPFSSAAVTVSFGGRCATDLRRSAAGSMAESGDLMTKIFDHKNK